MAIDDVMMNRRTFLSRFGTGAFATAVGGVAGFPLRASAGDSAAEEDGGAQAPSLDPSGRLIASAPVLQNAAETTMGVAFAVSADASGWVEISRSPDMRCADTVYR